MAGIPFEHEGCNGWAIYDSSNIAVEKSNNMHIAEVRIEEKVKEECLFISMTTTKLFAGRH